MQTQSINFRGITLRRVQSASSGLKTKGDLKPLDAALGKMFTAICATGVQQIRFQYDDACGEQRVFRYEAKRGMPNKALRMMRTILVAGMLNEAFASPAELHHCAYLCVQSIEGLAATPAENPSSKEPSKEPVEERLLAEIIRLRGELSNISSLSQVGFKSWHAMCRAMQRRAALALTQHCPA